MTPPLSGLRVIEFESLGPGPLTGRMLADMGAEVTVITRLQAGAVHEQLGIGTHNPLHRGKQLIPLNLKQSDALAQAMNLVAGADALIEGNRPGVMERLGLGPADCAARNPRLVYGRMTGWGQNGPLASAAGHDLNYVALTGLLSLSARRGQRPISAPTVMGDGCGALGLAFGMVSALFSARESGIGRVVDGAIIDVLSMLGSLAISIRAGGQIDSPQPSPFHDSPFYDVYTCADGGHITLGALEPQFYALLLQKLALIDVDPADQYDCAAWPGLKARFAALFLRESRAHWCALLEGSDACFAPVLSIAEAAEHPHNRVRDIYCTAQDGSLEVATAPKFLPLTATHS